MIYNKPRTLAELPNRLRDHCRGMWCKLADGSTGILAAYDETYTGDHPRTAVIIGPSEDGQAVLINRCEMQEITPLFGVLRAWKPDGTLVTADPEEYTADGRSRVYFEGIEKVAFPPGTKVRRWVGDWEEVE